MPLSRALPSGSSASSGPIASAGTSRCLIGIPRARGVAISFVLTSNPLTEGGLGKPELDRFFLIVLADYRNAVIAEQQSCSLKRYLHDRCKKRVAPLVKLGQEFLGA